MMSLKKWAKIFIMAAVVALGIGVGVGTAKADGDTVPGSETVYTDGSTLSVVKEFASPGGNISVKIMKDDATGRYFYAVANGGECVIQASRLGLITEGADFSEGVQYQVVKEPVIQVDEYELLNGKHDGSIKDTSMEFKFNLIKDGMKLTVVMRAYDDGMAFQYVMSEGASVKSEASEYVFSDDAIMWSYQHANVTYEGTYVEKTMKQLYDEGGYYTTPSLIKSGDNYILITEASCFDDGENFCSSYYVKNIDKKNIRLHFGNKQNGNVVMKGAFETPWRVAIIGKDLNTIANSDIVTSVCEPAADIDYSFVKPGRLAWSWWSSTGDNPIAFEPQYDYIDFAAQNGWEYVCLDYGWVLWDDYKAKVKELVDYAAKKGVGIWLWYGVNNVGHTAAGAYPKYSLLDEATIKTEMEWAHSIGIKGVKVDYYESDNQKTMDQMYMCAKIAADNQIMVLFHGCTNPGGENRTFPNVLSYEAVYGAEYYKWRQEPSTANIITYLFTRNAVGSADFTPTCLPVAGVKATYGFMLGTAIYVESGLVHFAENVNVYEGYAGLSLMNDVPCTWDESIVIEGYPGAYGTVARRSGSDWYMASLTKEARTVEVKLNFLGAGNYTAYIYKTNQDNSNVTVETMAVTNMSSLKIDLMADDGVSVKITKEEFDYTTDYEDNYTYIEAEKADLSGAAVLGTNLFNAQYSSGCMAVEYIGNGANNAVTYKVSVDKAGVYEVNVYYIAGAERRFMVSVNGDDANRVRTGKLYSGDWVSVKKEVLYLDLKAGENTIKFYNDEAFAPNLDRISIGKAVSDKAATKSDETEDEMVTVQGEGYEYTIYEAETGTVAGGATLEGTLVGWLGGGSSLTLSNVKVDKAGKYYIMIKYMTGEDRNLEVSANGGAKQLVACPSNGDYYSNPGAAYVELELQAGANVIVLENSGGFAPNIDCIGVSTTMVEDENNSGADKNDDGSSSYGLFGGNNIFIIIGVIMAIVVVVAVVLVVILKKKSSKKND